MAFGLATLAMAYISIVTERIKLTYTFPIFFIGLLFFWVKVPVDWPDPLWEHKWVKIITELIVVISLMGAGLKIGMRYGLHHWKRPLRLIHTTMPLYILVIFCLAKYVLKLDGASALLLAAVCAPTDPVLASDLQLQGGEPNDDEKNTGIRYLLTAEAGLNDGLVFPFVFLAVLWSKVTDLSEVDFMHWIGYYVCYKIIVGVLVGSVLGYLYSLSIKHTKPFYEHKVLSGFVGIALAIAAFAFTEVIGGYGFLSAFFAGLFAQYHHHQQRVEHEKEEILIFNEELEKLLIVLWTLIFGGFVATGIIGHTGVLGVLIALSTVFIVRPLTGRIALIGTKFTEQKKWATAFFGIKGVGSFFYLSFALYEGNFSTGPELYAIVSAAVMASILLHGLTGPRVVEYFKKKD